jgi:hypothetical protein
MRSMPSLYYHSLFFLSLFIRAGASESINLCHAGLRAICHASLNSMVDCGYTYQRFLCYCPVFESQAAILPAQPVTPLSFHARPQIIRFHKLTLKSAHKTLHNANPRTIVMIDLIIAIAKNQTAPLTSLQINTTTNGRVSGLLSLC